MRFKDLNLPSWTRELMKERKARKAILKASKKGYFEIYARWDRGNAWSMWKHYADGEWAHSQNGMLSQAYVPVYVRSSWSGNSGIEVSQMSFWNWNEDEDRYESWTKAERRMFIERMDCLTSAEKHLRDIKRWKVDRALREFASEGLDVQGVGFGWIDTHDFDNAKSALCLFGARDDGNEFRAELEEYT